jgi:hypothetical protein
MKSEENFTHTMNCESEKFQELLELYPETATNLKMRALEKRCIFMYYKKKASQRRRFGKQTSQKVETAHIENAELFKSTYDGEEQDSD